MSALAIFESFARSNKLLRAIAQKSRESLFLRLPLEIRRHIYDYALGGNEYCVYVPNEKPVCRMSVSSGRSGRQLLQTCSQVYREAVYIPYMSNTFYAYPHLLYRWSSTLLEGQRDAIATIRVNFPEARYGVHDLNLFGGLKRLIITYTPESHPPLGPIIARLRERAQNDHLTLIFKPFD